MTKAITMEEVLAQLSKATGRPVDLANEQDLDAVLRLFKAADLGPTMERFVEGLDNDQIDGLIRLVEVDPGFADRFITDHRDEFLAGVRNNAARIIASGGVTIDALTSSLNEATEQLTGKLKASLAEAIQTASEASPRP